MKYFSLLSMLYLSWSIGTATTPLPPIEGITWSEWAAVEISSGSEGSLLFHFFSLAPKPKGSNPIFNPRRGKDKEVKYFAELFHGGKRLGWIGDAHNNYDPRSIFLPQGIWHQYSSGFYLPPEKRIKGKTFLIPFGDLSAGDYEVRVTARELEGNPVTKVFPFQIKDGKLVGDAEITKKAFMKKHKIRLLEREYVYLKEKP